MTEFAHLHLHTEFSLLDGHGRIGDYVDRAVETGVKHMALTDHGVMYGAMEWHRRLTEAGLHPIVGTEAYLAEGSATSRERKSYHLLLLAENETGYRNLLKLSSKAALEGFYYRPRIDLDWLNEHREGIIATSACLGGPVANNVLHGDPDKARRYAGQLRDIFGPERFYIEVQDHGIREQVDTNPALIRIAKEMGVGLVATNDVHYCNEGDADSQDLLVCVQTNSLLSDPKRMKTDSSQLFLKSPEQMARVFWDLPESLNNTVKIAEMCQLDLGFKGYHLPEFDVPEGFTNESYLAHVVREGAQRKYGSVSGEVAERIDYELSVISNMGFTNYFLVVWDFVRFAKENGILVGPGRGSAAGSIVTYALDVTALDPLKYDLIFERFLNPSRISMPDIDIDFADDRRQEVIEYVVRKYGSDKVAQIITFGTLAAKASVRDCGRAMGRLQPDIDRVAKLIPVQPGMTIDKAMSSVPELQALYDTDAGVKELIDAAKKVEGIARHSSTHAAGVVISRDPLTDHVPLQRAGGKSEGEVTTQYPMGELENLGLLKMDFLGLSTLTIVGKAVELVRRKGVDLTIETIPMDDPDAYAMLCKGGTGGVFQLEGGMTTRMTIDVQPNCFEDLIALMALIRPGPMELAPDYISRKLGKTETVYQHPDLEGVLAETYGVALYQEQVMRIANVLAGFSLADSDGLRKAMGKKLPEVMKKYKDRFVDGCVGNGVQRKVAVDIWDMIEKFAGYGFNKAHSAAYAVIAAQTAYLRAHYPVEFMAAILSTEIGTTEKVVHNIIETRRQGISIMLPDINRSIRDFSVDTDEHGKQGIRFGLAAIRNVGEGAVRHIVSVRDDLPEKRFLDLEHFCEVVDWSIVTKRVVECLARGGALDCFGDRSAVIAAVDAAVTAGQRRQKAASRGQIGLFDMLAGPESEAARSSQPLPQVPALPTSELLAAEKELLGVYVSDHPLNELLERGVGDHVTIIDARERTPGQVVRLIGMVGAVRRITTRKNQTMAIVALEDLSATAEIVAFPSSYEQYSGLLVEGAILDISAKVDVRNDQVQFICESATDRIEVQQPALPPRQVVITLRRSAELDGDIEKLQDLAEMLREFPGDDQVVMRIPVDPGHRTIRSRSWNVDWSPQLAGAVEEMAITAGISVIEPKPSRQPSGLLQFKRREDMIAAAGD
ncbi:MAG TPA: DNA polymerase III subunit alpha [Thermomicrobiales bacterium]|jgi:DNA polymerase-3 subunit alpha|nr:DNA polymerase III subunit alpha [Thermomicrobiales bacterium]